MTVHETEAGVPREEPNQVVAARVVKGHHVASGRNGDPRYPGGTIRMQQPFFKALGLDLSALYPGTVNVDIAPAVYRVVAPRYTFRQVAWHPTAPAEDFSFLDVELMGRGGSPVAGFIYHPHPATKPCHFQRATVLELLLPFVPSLRYGMAVQLRIPIAQMAIEAHGVDDATPADRSRR
jgi:hypothetical protein